MRSRLAACVTAFVAFVLVGCASSSGRLVDVDAAFSRGDYYQAWLAVERVKTDYPDDPEVERVYWKVRIAYLLKEGQRQCFMNREDGDGGALECFEKVLVLDPGNEIASTWIRKCKDKLALRAVADGDRFRTRGELKEALIAYHQALTYQPGNAEAEEGLKLLGESWRKMQDEAHSHYLQGVRALADQLFRQTRYHLLIALDKDPTLEQAVDPANRAQRMLMQERFADAKHMAEQGYYAPALKEYEEIAAAIPDFDGIQERIEHTKVEVEAQSLASAGEMEVYRGEYAKARELLQKAYDMTQDQKESIGEKLLLVHEREIQDRYFAAKDLELQRHYVDALAAVREDRQGRARLLRRPCADGRPDDPDRGGQEGLRRRCGRGAGGRPSRGDGALLRGAALLAGLPGHRSAPRRLAEEGARRYVTATRTPATPRSPETPGRRPGSMSVTCAPAR